MNVVLPERLKQVIDRPIADGHAADEAEFLTRAIELYDDHLGAEDEIAAMVARADADVAAGRFLTDATAHDSAAEHEAAMARVRRQLGADAVDR